MFRRLGGVDPTGCYATFGGIARVEKLFVFEWHLMISWTHVCRVTVRLCVLRFVFSSHEMTTYRMRACVRESVSVRRSECFLSTICTIYVACMTVMRFSIVLFLVLQFFNISSRQMIRSFHDYSTLKSDRISI